jgi:hypothetical protein
MRRGGLVRNDRAVIALAASVNDSRPSVDFLSALRRVVLTAPSITMVLVEIRRGRSLDQRLEPGRRIVDICPEVLSVPKRTVVVEFTVLTGDEILREGE